MTTGVPGVPGPLLRSSVPLLAQSLAGYFERLGIDARVYLGLKHRDLWDVSRVVIIDGEFDGSNAPKPRAAGTFVAPWQKKSYNPRELVGWLRPVTLSIRAVDRTRIDSEAAQIEAMESLLEATVQGLQNAMATDPVTGLSVGIGQGNVDFAAGAKPVWVDPGTGTQQTYGKELIVGFVYKCVLFDLAQGVAFPSTNLTKGPLLSNSLGGVNASVLSTVGGTAVLAGLGLVNPTWVGMGMTIGGAASPGNNGTFPIAAMLSPASVVIANAGAVAPDGKNGLLSWQVAPLP